MYGNISLPAKQAPYFQSLKSFRSLKSYSFKTVNTIYLYRVPKISVSKLSEFHSFQTVSTVFYDLKFICCTERTECLIQFY